MSTIKRFEEIEGWQTARELTRLVYRISREGEFARDFGLRDQMHRAAVSIMSNITEGFESRTQALFIEFLGRAKGSAGELRAQTYVALDVGYIDQAQFQQMFDLLRDAAAKSAVLWLISNEINRFVRIRKDMRLTGWKVRRLESWKVRELEG
jgi:four helix bundle protein